MINVNEKNYVCHIDLAMDLIKGKWKAVILWHLNRGAKRFLQLQRVTSGISQKVLNEKLKELEEDGLIFKTIYPQVPPKVEYDLTEKGIEIIPALEILENGQRVITQQNIIEDKLQVVFNKRHILI